MHKSTAFCCGRTHFAHWDVFSGCMFCGRLPYNDCWGHGHFSNTIKMYTLQIISPIAFFSDRCFCWKCFFRDAVTCSKMCSQAKWQRFKSYSKKTSSIWKMLFPSLFSVQCLRYHISWLLQGFKLHPLKHLSPETYLCIISISHPLG